jgi:hypothetical protein
MPRILPFSPLSLLLSLLVPPLLLAGCASDLDTAAARAPKELPGLTAAQLKLCAGEPAAKNREGGNEIWSYFRESSSSVTTDSGLGSTPTNRGITTFEYARYCDAAFTLRDGRVVAVALRGRTSTGRPTLEPCGALVQSCLKLRARPQ